MPNVKEEYHAMIGCGCGKREAFAAIAGVSALLLVGSMVMAEDAGGRPFQVAEAWRDLPGF